MRPVVLSQDKEKMKREEGRTIGAVKEIAEWLLGMTGTVTRMEAYDISNISGFESVGSMVVYERGRPKRSDYRKFKTPVRYRGPDDYASMARSADPAVYAWHWRNRRRLQRDGSDTGSWKFQHVSRISS